jgi:phage head maturation protease
MSDDIRADHYRQINAAVQTPIDPSAAADITCFMTTDTVDADDEIMLPGGADLSRFEKNPVLLLCHGYGQPGSHHPLPIGRVVGTKKRPNGILGQVKFAESTAMGREVKGLFQEGMFRSFSIGFRSLESSPLTREEAASRADWKAAFERTRGKILVHRKWLLLELSAVPLPANPDALVTTFKSRGQSVPKWVQLEKQPMDDATDATDEVEPGGEEVTETPEVETKAVKPDDEGCDCGGADCPRCRVHEKAAEPEDEDEDEDPEEAEAVGFKRGVHVQVRAPHYKGVGVVQGVYRAGHVPHVEEDIKGTKDDPAARVKAYKAMGDGHVPTDDHVGVKCAHMKALAEPMKAPSTKAAPAPRGTKAVAAAEPLPPLEALSDEEVQRQAIEALGRIPKQVDAAIARYMGVV